MFNKKLKRRIEELEEQNQMFINLDNNWNGAVKLIHEINKNIHEIKNKIEPKPAHVYTHTVDAKELANEISKMPTKRRCGSGGCGDYFMVPVSKIKSILNG